MEDEWAANRVVNSPRMTVGLLRNQRRRSSTATSPKVSISDPGEGAGGFAPQHGPKPAEVYGFVASITTVIATVIYLAWAYTPEPWLHSLGVTYFPSKYWALATPAFAMVTVVLGMIFYLGLNFIVTPPPTSYSIMFDEYSREPQSSAEGTAGDWPIEPYSDIDICHINDLMFG